MLRDQILSLLGCGVLFALVLVPCAAESNGFPASRPEVSRKVETARLLLHTGRATEARELVRREIETFGGNAALSCVLGDVLFRLADLHGAEQAYTSALIGDPGAARGYLGLGRLELVHSRRTAARDLIAKAYRLDPRDPEIIAAYSEFTSDAQARAVLLRNLISLTQKREEAEASLAQLRIESRLNRRAAPQLASPYQRYLLNLAPLRLDGSTPRGLLIAARINGGKPLRLVLDSGANGILINGRAAQQLELESVAESRIAGIGGTGVSKARLTLAKTVVFGALEFTNCVVEVTEESLTRDADGVVGLKTFESFNIRIDPRAQTLELTPLEDEILANSSRFYGLQHMMLVQARLNGGKEGLFLLDTGAAFTAVAKDVLPPPARWVGISILGPGRSGMTGYRLDPVQFNFGGQTVVDRTPIALDLSHISEQAGVQISGILGYPLLHNSAITISYRDGFLRLQKLRN